MSIIGLLLTSLLLRASAYQPLPYSHKLSRSNKEPGALWRVSGHIASRAPEFVKLTANSVKLEGGAIASFTIPIGIGPADPSDPEANVYQTILDTGSDVIWVFSTLMDDNDQSTHKKYHFVRPEDCTDPESPSSDEINYTGGMKVESESFKNSLTIGGAEGKDCPMDAVKTIEGFSSDYDDKKIDGLFGAGHGNLKQWFTSAEISQQTITVNLNPTGESYVRLGQPDDSITPPNENDWIPLAADSEHGWHVSSNDNTAGLDTGSALLQCSPEDVDNYFKNANEKHQVGATKTDNEDKDENPDYWIVPCDANLPPFEVKLGSKTYKISGDKLLLGPDPEYAGKCLTAIDYTVTGQFNLGLPLFYDHYVLLDEANKRVRLVPKS